MSELVHFVYLQLFIQTISVGSITLCVCVCACIHDCAYMYNMCICMLHDDIHFLKETSLFIFPHQLYTDLNV